MVRSDELTPSTLDVMLTPGRVCGLPSSVTVHWKLKTFSRRLSEGSLEHEPSSSRVGRESENSLRDTWDPSMHA